MTDQLTPSNIIQILKATEILRAKTIPRTTPTEVKRDRSSRRTNKIQEKRNPNHRSSKNRQNETSRNHTCPLRIKEGRCNDQEKGIITATKIQRKKYAANGRKECAHLGHQANHNANFPTKSNQKLATPHPMTDNCKYCK